MKIPHADRQRTALDNESMTPMIDVVFLLLVFFVCASIGQKPEFLLPAEIGPGMGDTDAELVPAEPDRIPSPTVRIHLAVRPENGELLTELNDQVVPGAGDLVRRLRRLSELDANSKILLDVEDDVSVQQFVGIYDLCQALGFQSIAFVLKNSAAE